MDVTNHVTCRVIWHGLPAARRIDSGVVVEGWHEATTITGGAAGPVGIATSLRDPQPGVPGRTVCAVSG